MEGSGTGVRSSKALSSGDCVIPEKVMTGLELVAVKLPMSGRVSSDVTGLKSLSQTLCDGFRQITAPPVKLDTLACR